MNKNHHNIPNKKSTLTYNIKGNFMYNIQLHKYHKKYNTNTNNTVKKKKSQKLNLQFSTIFVFSS